MKNQKGYVIQIVLVVFAILIGMMIFPLKFPKSETGSNEGRFCVTPPASMPTILAPSYVTSSAYQVDGDGNNQGFNDSVETSGQTQYKMIKANVPIVNVGEDWFHFIATPLVNIDTQLGKRRILWPTAISGAYTIQLPDNGGEPNVVFHDYGIIFLQHLDENGAPKEVTSGKIKIPIADVYKDIAKPEIPYTDLFKCREFPLDAKYSTGYNSVVVPVQSPSKDKKQLQLEWFLLAKSPFKAAIMSSGCKPAVYLYPPKKQLVNVRVIPSGFLTYVDPPYDNEKGWTVYAYPDGSLSAINDERLTNNYLYFESKIRDEVIKKPTQGWVVEYGRLTKLYREILPKLGLNENQQADFIEYWSKALSKDPAPYYFVGVIDQENVNEIERLDITPKPDSINRVRVYFERLDAPKVVQAPDMSSISNLKFKISNSHFSVVEWGGMVKNDSKHSFTCSQ